MPIEADQPLKIATTVHGSTGVLEVQSGTFNSMRQTLKSFQNILIISSVSVR